MIFDFIVEGELCKNVYVASKMYHRYLAVRQGFLFTPKTGSINLDPSYQTDLDLWGYFGRENTF